MRNPGSRPRAARAERAHPAARSLPQVVRRLSRRLRCGRIAVPPNSYKESPMQRPRARPLRATTLMALLAGALAATSAVHAQMMGNRGSGTPLFKPGPGPDELWEVTTRMEAMGMA